MEMPTGTVTFLFTDVVGSTRLWEAQPEAMRRALVRHDSLLRDRIEAQGGKVFKTIGDAFCAAFALAGQALEAAISIQLALAAEPETEDEPRLQIRIALHSGVADERDGDYFGPCLNRCARLLDIGHGQQILLSQVTRELIAEHLPEATRIEDLGRHRLRDLAQPVQVFQITHAALPSTFPALRSLESRPNNLPRLANRLIGREAELAAVSTLLDAERLVTVTGAGGSGKTRLSLQVAAERLEQHPDGVWLVELAALDDGQLIEKAIATAIGLTEVPGVPMTETLIDHLRDRRALLLLDNCEHLIDDCARLIQRLLVSCAALRCLATSREGLRLAGEALYPLPPLALPRGAPPRRRDPAWLEAVAASESVELFVERAQAVLPDFQLDLDNAEAVIEICRQLDGVALAIELAAVRVKVLGPAQIAQRLDNHLRLLTRGRRGVLPRQQTMRAAVEWSYALLEEQEQLMLTRLGVFSGGWTLELAERVCADEAVEDWEVLDILARLVEKSLVLASTDAGPSRYRMLESIRQFAVEKLDASEQGPGIRKKHLETLVDLALAAEPELVGPDQALYLDGMQREHENIRAAIGHALTTGFVEPGLKLASALLDYWRLRGHLSEGLMHLRALLSAAAPEAVDARVRAKALNAAGALAYFQGDFVAAKRDFEASLAFWEALADRDHIEKLTNNLGVISRSIGDLDAARSYLNRSLDMSRSSNDQAGIVAGLTNLAMLAHEDGQLVQALELMNEALVIQRGLGEAYTMAVVLITYAEILWLMGESEPALAAARESLDLYREAGTEFGASESLELLAKIHCDAKHLNRARALATDCLIARRALGDAQGITDALICLGAIHLRARDLDLAGSVIEEGLASARQGAFKRGIANALLLTGRLHLARGELGQAVAAAQEAIAIIAELGSRLMAAAGMETAALVLRELGAPGGGLELERAAQALRQACGAPRPDWLEDELAPLRAGASAAASADSTAALTAGAHLPSARTLLEDALRLSS